MPIAKNSKMIYVKYSKFREDFNGKAEAIGIAPGKLCEAAGCSSATLSRMINSYVGEAVRLGLDTKLDLGRIGDNTFVKLCDRAFLDPKDYITDEPEPLPKEPEPAATVIKPVRPDPAGKATGMQPELYDELMSVLEKMTKVLTAEGNALDKLVKQGEQQQAYLEEVTQKLHTFDARSARVEGILNKMEQSLSGTGKMLADARKPFDDIKNKVTATNQMANSIWQNTKQISRILSILDAWASGR